MRGLTTVRAILPPLSIAIFGFLLLKISWAAIPFILFGIADSIGRYRDFAYLQKQRYLTTRLVDFYGRSFCGRNVVTTIRPHWREYYKSQGYRWYHFLPDGFPGLLLSKSFWRTLVRGHRHGAVK